MKFKTVTKLFSLLFLASFMPLMMSAETNTAYAQTTHTITINNNCSDTVHVGAVPPVQSVSVGGVSQTTLGGWEMTTGQSATVLVPLSYNSGRFWARTGCNFNTTGTCDNQTVKVNGTDYIIANCCDTGGCTNSSGDFALDCVNTGLPPATLAEITFVQNGQDSYDVSMVDGGNISVDMIPDSSTYTCDAASGCIFDGTLPGKTNSTCTQDSDCYPLFGFGYKFKCDPNLKMCVNPYFCGSPGCTDTKGCAPDGITQTTLPHSTWGGSGLAISESNCPADMQLTNDQNQGSTYVGCFAPQKFCRKSCSADGDCGPPYTFNCGTTSGYCEDTSGTVLGADCDTTVGNTTNEQLWACTGVNAGSCFTTGTTDANCCGCPNWAPGFPNAAPDGACVAGNNSNWGTNAQPIFSAFNDASPTAYAFPFDDAIKLFACQAKAGSVTNYTINFCGINSDGDNVFDKNDTDSDNDCIANNDEILAMASQNLTREAGMDVNDIDGDGVTNEFDLDSDNDGLPDIVDAGGAVLDQDFNGRVDDNTDVDLDGLADIGDPTEGGEILIPPDTDGDGIPNTLDIDSDNDGRTDFEESGGFGDNDGDGLVDDKTDSNGDGYLDVFDPDFGGTPLTIVDSNGDGLPDRLDASDGSSGCSLASKGQSSSILILMLLPAIVIWRRIFRNMA